MYCCSAAALRFSLHSMLNEHNTSLINRVVERSSDLRTSNVKLKFVFVFQPFDIRIQASLIRVDADGYALKVERCYFSGALFLHRLIALIDETISVFSADRQFK